jgi:hypothetical protein
MQMGGNAKQIGDVNMYGEYSGCVCQCRGLVDVWSYSWGDGPFELVWLAGPEIDSPATALLIFQ